MRRGRIDERDVHAELDAQYDRFLKALAGPPDYIDGHQHVHFLPTVQKLAAHAVRGKLAQTGAARGAGTSAHGCGGAQDRGGRRSGRGVQRIDATGRLQGHGTAFRDL
ncbi:ChbG/HpnK family deacetylase [Mesorhizobium atlanticum]